MAAAEDEKDMDATRDRVQNWLMNEGWQLAEQSRPNMAWLIRAEDGAQRRILIGQFNARPDHIQLEARVQFADEHRQKFESLAEQRRRDILWKLRFRLLMMNVEFAGVTDPMQSVVLTQRIYLDGLTRDAFIQRFLVVCNALTAVIWSILQDLEGVEPPSESAKPKSR